MGSSCLAARHLLLAAAHEWLCANMCVDVQGVAQVHWDPKNVHGSMTLSREAADAVYASLFRRHKAETQAQVVAPGKVRWCSHTRSCCSVSNPCIHWQQCIAGIQAC